MLLYFMTLIAIHTMTNKQKTGAIELVRLSKYYQLKFSFNQILTWLVQNSKEGVLDTLSLAFTFSAKCSCCFLFFNQCTLML